MNATKTAAILAVTMLCAASAATTYNLMGVGEDPSPALMGSLDVSHQDTASSALVSDGVRHSPTPDLIQEPEKLVCAAPLPHGVFPHYAGVEILPGVTFEDILDAHLTDEDAMKAISSVNALSRQLSHKAYHDADAFHDDLSEREAGELSSQGIPVMTTKARSDGKRKWFTCPPSYQAQVYELQLAAQAIRSGSSFIEGSKARLMESAALTVDVSGATAVVREDETGINLVDSEGNVLSWSHFSIPGKIPLASHQ